MEKEYKYNAEIVRVYDGDTVWVDIDLGFDIWIRNQSVRIEGINTPEIRTKNKLEKFAGEVVKEFVERLFPAGSPCILISREFEGKFGRILGDISVDGLILSEALLDMEYAVPYDGGKRGAFDEEFLINICNCENGKNEISNIT